MRKARSILNGKDTPCLFLCVTHENLVCIVGYLFYRNAFGIIGIINSNMSISLCLKKRGIYDICNPICLYPVSYEQERNPMSVVLGNFVALSLDAVNGKISGQNPELLKYQFLILNLMCVKHRSWKQENEFRILFPYPRLRENGKRVGLKDIGLEISAIYLGKDCSIRNQNRLKGVSINLGIDLYKMRVNNQSRKFDMCFDRIQ